MDSKWPLVVAGTLAIFGCSAAGPSGESTGAPGSLDAAFGSAGIVTTPIGSSVDTGSSVAIQSDGKILVAGSTVGASNLDFALVRYNTDGSLDTGFGTGGKVTTPVSTGNDTGTSVAVQSDGKIVVAGYGGTTKDFELVRYNSDGSLDTTGFGTGGKVTTSIIGDDQGHSVAVQSDGKIVVAGYVDNSVVQNFALVRYNANGSLDTTGFGTGGVVTTAINGGDYGYSVAIQSDGKILVAGDTWGGIYDAIELLRYNSNGSLDTTGFGTTGKVTTSIGSRYNAGYSVAIQSDGKILVAGISANATDNDFAVVRYNTNGSLDTGFGASGKVTTAIGSGDDSAYSVAIQSDGKIVVAGYSQNGATGYDFALVRYNVDGSLDTSFGKSGIATTAVSSANDYGYSVAIQSDGKIILAGTTGDGASADFAVARYTP